MRAPSSKAQNNSTRDESSVTILYTTLAGQPGTLITQVLEQNRYRALQVSPKLFEQKLAEESPDLVLLDFTLSQDRRLLLAKYVKETHPNIPILVLHGSGGLHNPFADYAVDSRDGTAPVLQAVSMLLLTRRSRAHQHPQLSGDYLIFADSNRNIVEITDKTCELLGYPRPLLIGRTVEEISVIPAPDVKSMFTTFLEDGRMEGQYQLRHRSGKPVTVSFNAVAFPDGCLISSLTPHQPGPATDSATGLLKS